MIFAIRAASTFIAFSVVSYGMVFEGNDHTLPSGMEPKPFTTLPAAFRPSLFTFKQRDAIDFSPAELDRCPVL